jgi:hypothetical protein
MLLVLLAPNLARPLIYLSVVVNLFGLGVVAWLAMRGLWRFGVVVRILTATVALSMLVVAMVGSFVLVPFTAAVLVAAATRWWTTRSATTTDAHDVHQTWDTA